MAGFETPTVSRRGLLAGAGGLVIAMTLPLRARAQAGAEAGEALAPNAFIRVGEDDIVTILSKHIEFGQGPFTGLATIAADEMDADWAKVRAEHAPSNPQLYANAAFGIQGTGGSSAIASSFDIMRKAGASAKAVLIAAAAKTWGVPASEITVAKGVVSHAASGRSATFGELASAAAEETPPADPTLKTPDQWVYIGKEDLPKLDTAAKSTGAADFTLDLYREGMLTAVVEHPKKFGAVVGAFDDAQARAVPGVVDVKAVPDGVAVIADNTYAALMGRKALSVTWDEANAETRSTEEIAAERISAVRERGDVAGQAGDVDAGFNEATTILQADYVFPYLVHAPMEPLDAVIERRADGGIEAWMGSQIQTTDHAAIAEICGVEFPQVTLNTVFAGGSFGRRAQPKSEFAREAAHVFMAAGGERPVKLMWTREDDIQGGFYRPLTAHRLRGGINAAGDIVAWEQTVAAQSFLVGSAFEGLIQDGIDSTMVEGASETPYAFANHLMTAHIVNNPVPTLWWRSVGHTHTGYTVETFLDELLEAGGKDAVEGRLALMSDDYARLAGTLTRAAEMADWGRAAPEGRALGVASVKSFNSYVSQVADVSIENGVPRVHKVWCAVDCGVPVNPEVIKAQMEGGIGYGLGAVLFNELRLKRGGEVAQSNFHDYRSLRIGEMPDVEVAVIASTEAPTGVGEPGTPPIGPAVANAVRKLTGQPVRRLPMVQALQA
ncbi:MAG: xanthine dehydrogenase family protein molybdopterin-binding subunit [Pseudomonadota bacterium]